MGLRRCHRDLPSFAAWRELAVAGKLDLEGTDFVGVQAGAAGEFDDFAVAFGRGASVLAGAYFPL